MEPIYCPAFVCIALLALGGELDRKFSFVDIFVIFSKTCPTPIFLLLHDSVYAYQL